VSWIEQCCRWSLAYAYLDWAYLRPHRGRRDWQAPLHAYALALGLDPEEGR
jgi:hypothetical protein